MTNSDAVILLMNSEYYKQGYKQGVSDVLDKISTEIKALSPEPTAYDVVEGNPVKDAVWETLNEVLQIIDKYKTESEEE
jgi:hypothetical protein